MKKNDQFKLKEEINGNKLYSSLTYGVRFIVSENVEKTKTIHNLDQ